LKPAAVQCAAGPAIVILAGSEILSSLATAGISRAKGLCHADNHIDKRLMMGYYPGFSRRESAAFPATGNRAQALFAFAHTGTAPTKFAAKLLVVTHARNPFH